MAYCRKKSGAGERKRALLAGKKKAGEQVSKKETHSSQIKNRGLFQGVFRKKDSDTTKIKLDIAFVFCYMYNVVVIKNIVL